MGCLSQRGHEISVGVDFADEAWEETWTLLVEEVAAGTRLVLGIDGVSAGFSLHGSRQAMNAFQACSGTIRELVSEPAGAGDAGPSVLGRYPCAAALSPPALDYLGDWANATGSDPCLLGPDEFAGIFGFPMATGEVRAGEAD